MGNYDAECEKCEQKDWKEARGGENSFVMILQQRLGDRNSGRQTGGC